MSVDRAAFLRASGALVVSFAVPARAGAALADATAAAGAGPYAHVDPSQLDSWLTIAHDGSVTAFTGRIDFGQHKRTAFAQIVAEELDVPFHAVQVIMGDTASTPNQGSSSASDGILYGARPLRHAAAEARRVLLDLAADKLGVPASALVVADGVVHAPGSAASVAYGTLLAGRRFDIALKVSDPDSLTTDVQGTAPLKDPSRYKVVGRSVPAADIPSKVDGSFPRVHSVRLPQMLHARVILPPSPGAHIVQVGAITPPVKGVRVIVKGDFVGIVARTEWAAIQGAQRLAIEWSPAATLPGPDGIPNYLRTSPAMFPQKRINAQLGDVDASIAAAAHQFEAAYDYPMQNHGMIGPSCGVADVRADRVIAYAGTQDPGATRGAIATALGVPLDRVRVMPMEPSGCYGRLGLDDATVAAAVLSQAVGKPVRVQFTRGQEHTWEPLQPPSSFTLRAGVDADGKIVAWDQEEWSWAWVDAELPLMLVPGDEITGKRYPLFRGVAGGESNAYTFDNLRVRANTVKPLLRGWAMRSPGRVQVNFAGEQFLDEIAAATKQDPIALRLRHLADERTIAVLEAAAKAANWQTRPSPSDPGGSTARKATGRGVSVVANQRSTYVATVAEVEVDRLTGVVTVKRLVMAVDPGLIINPNGLLAQIEGSAIYATSRALKEEVKVDHRAVTTDDWLTYPILRFTEVPRIDVVLLPRTDKPAGGIGEPPNTTPVAAIGNAIFDATGVRLRTVPYTPAVVKAALTQVGHTAPSS